MRPTTVLAAVFMLALGAQGSSQERIDAIWAAANDRMVQQLDGWFEDGEFPSCVELLEMRFDLDPHDYEIATDLGWMQENIERYDEAQSTYTTYLAMNPKDPDRSLPIGQFWYMKKDYGKVVEMVGSRIQDDSHPNLFRILAHSYERTGKLRESDVTWSRYIKLKPDDGAAKANRARVQQKLAEGGAPKG